MSVEKSKQAIDKIIKHIDHTMEYCKDYDFDAFMENKMLQEACVFNVLQIGELSKMCIDASIISQYPEIPWNQIYGMRNRLVHDYDGIRLFTVWITITEDFPILKNQLLSILSHI